MDDAMRDAFARQGYIVVPDVLNQQQLDELNQVYDQHVLEREEMRSTAGTDKQIRFSWLAPNTWPAALKAMGSGLVDVKSLVSHEYALADLIPALGEVKDRTGDPIKPVVKP